MTSNIFCSFQRSYNATILSLFLIVMLYVDSLEDVQHVIILVFFHCQPVPTQVVEVLLFIASFSKKVLCFSFSRLTFHHVKLEDVRSGRTQKGLDTNVLCSTELP